MCFSFILLCGSSFLLFVQLVLVGVGRDEWSGGIPKCEILDGFLLSLLSGRGSFSFPFPLFLFVFTGLRLAFPFWFLVGV